MGRAPCCAKVGLKKGPWTAEEDEKLSSYIIQHGHASWRTLPQKAGLLRCGKSCRLRWANYLRPDIKRGEFSAAEEQSIIQLHALLGNRWSAIATQLPKRTDNEIKNHWNTHLKKRLLKMGLDPATHKPITRETSTSSCNSAGFLDSSSTYKRGSSSSVSHMAQWETARLEAEARLKKESSLRAKGLWGPVSLISPKAGSLGSEAAPSGCADGPPSYKGPLMSSKNDPDGHATPSTNQDDGDMAVSHCGLSAGEVLNTLQNWEYSLQGQAGLMWPESWRMSNKGRGSLEGQELSSCSSSAVEQVCHGSPRSPLCSLDHPQLLKQFNSSPAAVSRKLSWIDSLPAMVLTSPASCGLCSNQISEDPMTEKNDLGCNRTARLTSILLDELNLESEDISSTTLNSSMVCKLTTEEFLDWDNIALEDCPKDGMMKAAESIFF